MSKFVPQAAPNLRIKRFMPSVEAAVARTLSSDTYILGPEVVRFERSFADLSRRAAIVMAGLTPRYIDVERASRCMDLDAMAAAITPRTAVDRSVTS